MRRSTPQHGKAVVERCRMAFGCLLLGLTAAAHGDELPDSIVRVLAALGVPPEDVSIVVQAVDARQPVLSHLPDEPRNPASVMKLVTTYSALELLGPSYSWPTEVYFLGDFDGRTLDGDLALKGYGDPFLVVEELWNLLRGLRRVGLREIRGDLVLDDSYFDVPARNPGAFDGQRYRAYNVLPNALLANFKAVQFHFLADPVNDRVVVSSDPELDNLRIDNRLGLADGPCRGYQGGISFNVADPGTASRVVFEGNFPARCESYSFSRAVLEHDTYFYGLFRSLWNQLGGSFSGQPRRDLIAEEAEPAYIWQSAPLAEIIRGLNKNSNNVMARQVLLTLGAEGRGAPGTAEKGAAVVDEFLSERGLDTESLRIVNGAGLSRGARVTAAMLVGLLRTAAASPYAPEFIASLSISGVDGTTRSRFDDDSGSGLMHLKTGRLDGASGLAGYAQTPDGTDYALAIIMNHGDAHRGLGQEVDEAVTRWLFNEL